MDVRRNQYGDWPTMDTILKRTTAAHKSGVIQGYLGELINNLEFGPYGAISQDPKLGGKVILTPNGFENLIKDRLEFGSAFSIFKDPNVSNTTKLALVQEKGATMATKPVNFRARFDLPDDWDPTAPFEPQEVYLDAILSDEYSHIDNLHVIQSLIDLVQDGALPEDMVGHTFYIKDGFMHMRLIAPNTWTKDFGGDPHYGSIVIQNDEFGRAQFSMKVAVQRLACTNYSIGETVASATHRWSNNENFLRILGEGAGGIDGGFKQIEDRSMAMKEEKVKYPEDMIDYALREGGGNQKFIREAALEYMDDTRDETVYGVLQAVTYATQKYSQVRGRRPPAWQRRTSVEENVWSAIGVNLMNAIREGVQPEEIYLTPETNLLDRVSEMIRSRSTEYDGETKNVLETIAQDVLVIDPNLN